MDGKITIKTGSQDDTNPSELSLLCFRNATVDIVGTSLHSF